jgi:Glycosyl transferase family 2
MNTPRTRDVREQNAAHTSHRLSTSRDQQEGARDVRTLPLPKEGRVHPWTMFFDGLRQTRRERYAAWKPGSGAGKRCAVQTIVHNEAALLPIWLRYYSRFFGADDIYVLDNDSTDGSTSGRGFVRVPVSHDRVDHTWMVRTLESHQHELLERYDVVLTTDVDEIVAPLPEWGTLGDYLDRFDEEFVNCIGYEILHMKDIEPPYRPDRPVLEQRGYWFAAAGYDKPALASVPMKWKPGFHEREDGELAFDPDLYMIHLHRMDFEISLERHRLRERRAWDQRDLDKGWALHNLITDEDEFERWFYSDAVDSGRVAPPIELEPIPPAWTGVF